MKLKLALAAIFLMSSLAASAIEIGVGKGQIIKLSRPAAHVFIADPDIADIDVRSPDYIYVYGLKVGETSLHALDSNSNTIMQADVIVSPNYSNVSKILKEVLPQSNVHFSAAANGLIVEGEVNTPEDAEKALAIINASSDSGTKVVNMLKIRGSDQVMLRVRIAEVSRTELKNFGINLGDILNRGSFAFGLLSGRPFVDPTAFAGVSQNNGDNVLTIGGRLASNNITGVIDALETQGLVKTLAEPNLTAKSGESASFLAGGEFPIPVPQQNGVTTIEYQQYGVQLDFTPTVLSNDKISLKVAPNVSSLATSTVTIANNNVPSLTIRKASTTVELGSGESFAIAGLLQNDATNNINKFPWLGDIPVLGALFSSNDFQKDETELVVIVTPYIVHGVKDGTKLMTPTDGLTIPNDADRILLGKTYADKPAPGRAGTGEQEGVIAKYKLHGDSGYMLEDQQ